MLLNLHGRALQEQSQCPQIATAQQNLKLPAAIPFPWDVTPQATAMDAPSTKNNPITPWPLDMSWWLACKKRPSICTRELFFGDKRSDDFLGLFLLAADSKQYFFNDAGQEEGRSLDFLKGQWFPDSKQHRRASSTLLRLRQLHGAFLQADLWRLGKQSWQGQNRSWARTHTLPRRLSSRLRSSQRRTALAQISPWVWEHRLFMRELWARTHCCANSKSTGDGHLIPANRKEYGLWTEANIIKRIVFSSQKPRAGKSAVHNLDLTNMQLLLVSLIFIGAVC